MSRCDVVVVDNVFWSLSLCFEHPGTESLESPGAALLWQRVTGLPCSELYRTSVLVASDRRPLRLTPTPTSVPGRMAITSKPTEKWQRFRPMQCP
jgi:hypothetical protein